GGRGRGGPGLPPAQACLPALSHDHALIRWCAPRHPDRGVDRMTTESLPRTRHRPRCLAALLLMLATLATGLPASAGEAPRERIRLDEGWRFHRGDPPGVDGRLDYDVRPQVAASADGKDADSRPDAAVRVQADRPVLEPWILPTANRFIRAPSPRHVPPAPHPDAHDTPC